MWFLLAALFGLIFILVFIFWPASTSRRTPIGSGCMRCTTPLIGLTLGATILLFGLGVVSLAKKIMPHEVAIQQRHVGMSDEI